MTLRSGSRPKVGSDGQPCPRCGRNDPDRLIDCVCAACERDLSQRGPWRPDPEMAAAIREARAVAWGVWCADHQDKCGCDDPDSAFCEWPVPFDHTMSELRAVLND